MAGADQPRWAAALLSVAVVALFFADSALGTLPSLLMAAALVPIWMRVLRSSVDDWESGDLAVPESEVTSDTPAVATP